MAYQKGLILTGARARFSIEGKRIGYARGVTVTEGLGMQPIDCLDNIRTLEHVPIGYTVGLTCELFKLIGQSLKAAGFFPKVGQSAEEHLRNVVSSGEMTAVLEDSITGARLATVSGVKVTSHNWTTNAREAVGEGVEFVAILCKDESETTTD
jgi:hypothetical protein